MEKTPGNQALWHLAQTAADDLGFSLNQATAGGGSDGNTTSLYTPTLDGLGAVGDNAHARGEFVYLDSLIERNRPRREVACSSSHRWLIKPDYPQGASLPLAPDENPDGNPDAPFCIQRESRYHQRCVTAPMIRLGHGIQRKKGR